MLKLENISKSFGDKAVIRKLSYYFDDAKIYSVSGSSGCGKSTLLELISGTESCDEGKISSGTVSMSFQAPTLLPSCTVLENVMLGSDIHAKPADMTKKEFFNAEKQKALGLLGELGIDNPSQKPQELSGGMQARVGIARALMRKTDVYLFDEPFAGLDSESISRTVSVIRKYTAGSTVIAVVHDSVNCPDFADVNLRLESGEETFFTVL